MKPKLLTFFLALVASAGTTLAETIERVQIGDLYYTTNTAEVASMLAIENEEPQSDRLKVVSDSTTWDFSKLTANAESSLYVYTNDGIRLTTESTPSITDEVIYADYADIFWSVTAGFNDSALAFTGEYPIGQNKFCQNGVLRFNAAADGNIIVKFSDTGSKANATAIKRFLVVNGDTTEFWSSRANNGTENPYDEKLNVVTEAIPVPAGNVTITGTAPLRFYYVTVYGALRSSVNANPTEGRVTGEGNYFKGNNVTMEATPNYGYHFFQWSDGIATNPRTFTITQDTTFTAEFTKNTYTISTTSANPEWGTTAGDTAALYLDEVEISAIPNYGYHFTKWDIEKYQEYIEYGTLHVVKFSVPETWSNPYAWVWETGGYGHWETLSYEDGMYVYRTTQNNMNIIVVPNGPDWGSGQTNDLAITESCCYTISDEYDVYNRYVTIKNYDCFSTEEQAIIDKLDTITYVDTTITTYTTNPLSLLVAQNQKAIAYFAKNIYSITKNAEHGSIDGNASAEYLDEVTMIAIPDYGYHFAQWSDGNTDNPRTIILTQDTTFTAEFAKNTYSVSTTSTNPEWGTTAGDTAALYLDEVEISAIPNYGYHFVRWNDYNTSNPRTVSVTKDTTFTATFAKNVYFITKNAEHGSISGNSSAEYLDFVTLTVTPDYGYHFTQWSDGLKDNPRIFQITSDTTFTAEFAYDRVGACGKDLALVWTYDPTNKVLTIGNAGSFTENMQYGVEAPNEMEELVIGNSVTAIGANAFAGIETLKKVSIGESVKTIGEQAFYNCVNLETIFNYRPTPTNTYSNAFDGVDKFECELYVLPSSIDMYKAAAVWRDFYYTYAIGAEETTITADDVTVEPQNNAVTLTWPTDDNAASYTIEITKDGVLFCTLIFNANGQLTGIAFAPSRNGSRNIPAATMTAKGLQFTVTGLNSNTQYGYSITAKDSNEQDVATYSGEFTTTGEDEPTGIDNTNVGTRASKILRNGQIFILRGEKVYSLDGRLVR